MSREANMEMERSRRQHEYEKKFGKDYPDTREWDNEKQEWKKSQAQSHDPYYPNSHKNIGGKK
jgi:hypothetical protein